MPLFDSLSALLTTGGVSANVLSPSLDCIEKSNAIEVHGRKGARRQQQSTQRQQRQSQRASSRASAKGGSTNTKYRKVSQPGASTSRALATSGSSAAVTPVPSKTFGSRVKGLLSPLKRGASAALDATSGALKKGYSAVRDRAKSLSASASGAFKKGVSAIKGRAKSLSTGISSAYQKARASLKERTDSAKAKVGAIATNTDFISTAIPAGFAVATSHQQISDAVHHFSNGNYPAAALNTGIVAGKTIAAAAPALVKRFLRRRGKSEAVQTGGSMATDIVTSLATGDTPGKVAATQVAGPVVEKVMDYIPGLKDKNSPKRAAIGTGIVETFKALIPF